MASILMQARKRLRYSLAVVALVVILCVHGTAWAACNITITQTTALSWGTWQQPSSGSQTADITTADVTSGTGTKLYGTAGHGVFTITNNPQCTGTMTITLTDTGGASGVTLGSFHLNWNGSAISNGQSGLTFPGNSTQTLLVGATATYTSSVAIGTASPTFQIAVTDSGTSTTKTLSSTASIGFDSPITFVKNSDINFGTVSSSTVSTYRISTAGATSVVSGSGQFFSGSPTAANITIKGSSTDGITIQAGSFTANNGATPSNATCSYNGGASASCTSAITGVAPTSAGKTLLVGVDVAADGTQTGGSTATPSFTITVNYQ